mmetsp:Transcript_59110/g.129482  ORF Transcript_59110/g.129482 Transcript_59110/m.129482 type:complete len:242 (-) Transcript_59110:3-728(-)
MSSMASTPPGARWGQTLVVVVIISGAVCPPSSTKTSKDGVTVEKKFCHMAGSPWSPMVMVVRPSANFTDSSAISSPKTWHNGPSTVCHIRMDPPDQTPTSPTRTEVCLKDSKWRSYASKALFHFQIPRPVVTPSTYSGKDSAGSCLLFKVMRARPTDAAGFACPSPPRRGALPTSSTLLVDGALPFTGAVVLPCFWGAVPLVSLSKMPDAAATATNANFSPTMPRIVFSRPSGNPPEAQPA